MNKALEANYVAAGFARTLGFGQRPALLLIDFVGAYFDPTSPLYAQPDTALAAAMELLAAARQAGLLVLHTRVSYAAGGADGGVFFRKVGALSAFAADADPALGAIHPKLTPAAGEIVIVKQYASAFFGTSLASTLTSSGVDTLLIGGLSTSGCVRATAVDAIQHGFIPLVVREAVGDRAQSVHEANLFDLAAKYADVIDLAAVRAHLSGSMQGETH